MDQEKKHRYSSLSGNKFGPQSKNLASIIRGFKIGVKKYANENDLAFAWQRRFHDHIIRDENELNSIRKYILNNPGKWKSDEYHPGKILNRRNL